MIEKASSIAVVIASLAVVIGLARQFKGAESARPPLPSYEVGQTFPALDGLQVSQNGTTLVAWLRSTCIYCTQSMDFYRALVAKPRRGRLVVVGLESTDVLTRYLAQHDVQADAVLSVTRDDTIFMGTPTLVAFGSDRKIVGVWRGRVRAKAEEEAIERLFR